MGEFHSMMIEFSVFSDLPSIALYFSLQLLDLLFLPSKPPGSQVQLWLAFIPLLVSVRSLDPCPGE